MRNSAALPVAVFVHLYVFVEIFVYSEDAGCLGAIRIMKWISDLRLVWFGIPFGIPSLLPLEPLILRLCFYFSLGVGNLCTFLAHLSKV